MNAGRACIGLSLAGSLTQFKRSSRYLVSFMTVDSNNLNQTLITDDSLFNLSLKKMESLQEKPQPIEVKPVTPVRSQRSPIVQKKVDEANEDLAKLSQESLNILLSRGKRKE